MIVAMVILEDALMESERTALLQRGVADHLRGGSGIESLSFHRRLLSQPGLMRERARSPGQIKRS